MLNAGYYQKTTLAIKNSFFNRDAIIIALLLVVAFLSAFSVVVEKDTYRQRFIQSMKLNSEKIKLQTKWSQLIIEESTWGSLARVERIAKQDLNMHVPKASEIAIEDI